MLLARMSAVTRRETRPGALRLVSSSPWARWRRAQRRAAARSRTHSPWATPAPVRPEAGVVDENTVPSPSRRILH